MKSILCLVFGLALVGHAFASMNDINSDHDSISPATPAASSTQSSEVSEVAASPMQPIMRAIEIIEFVSKFSNSESDGFGVSKLHSAMEETSSDAASNKVEGKSAALIKTSDPLTALSSVVVYGAVKITSMLLSALMYTLTMLAPGVFETHYSVHFKEGGSPLDNVDYDVVSGKLKSLTSRSFDLFDIREEECQNRAMCEIGQSISGFFPQVSRWIRLIEQFLIMREGQQQNLHTDAILRGLAWSDCNVSFKSCPRSPFKKFQHLISTFSKLY